MTDRLYYLDSHISTFTARVTDCRETDGGYLATLDRTAFFPEGGGQAGDIGVIGPARVTDTQEADGEVVHLIDSPLSPGVIVECAVNWETRFCRMQNHSGEHIVSGLVHSSFGLDNVGFHMGDRFVTVDYNGELSQEQIDSIERLANEAVCRNVEVRTGFPTPEELARMTYRSKLDFTENVRIVDIDGYDVCACCAPHVQRTGEIGVIKLLDFMRHRGGTRLNMICGYDALEDYRMRYRSTVEISNELSAKQDETPAAVRRLKDELYTERGKSAELSDRLVSAIAERVQPTDGNVCVFSPGLTQDELRELVNRTADLCGGVCAAFSGSDGAYRYVMGSRRCDMRSLSKTINAAINGRGGGTPEMISGASGAARDEIERYFAEAMF